MKFLIPLCVCIGLTVAQAPGNDGKWSTSLYPNTGQWTPEQYQTQGAPNAAPAGAAAAYGRSPAAYQQTPQASATLASRPWAQASAAPVAPQYAAPRAAYAGALQAAPAGAAVNGIPTQYGWNVQHSSPAPQPQAQQALIPTSQPAPAQYAPQQYAPQQAQYAPQAYAPQAAAPRAWSPPQATPVAAPAASFQAATNPALARPASVHFANIGESLQGDYKFGYRTGNGDSFREESRLPDGTVQGQYGFVDADGKERTVKYSAGVNGFQVLNDGASAAPAAAPRQQAYAPQPQQQWGAPQAAASGIPSWAGQGAGAPPSPAAAPQQQWGAAPQAAAQQQWG